MEPLTAVGLASNVVQFISFAGDLISKGKEIARSADGALIENHEIEAVTQSLHDLSRELIVPEQNAQVHMRTSKKISKAEQELFKLCEGAQEVAQTLLTTLRNLKAPNIKRTPWTSFRQAFLAVMSTEKVDQLSVRLERYHQQINTALLVSLREQVSNKPDYKSEMDHLVKVDLNWRKELIKALREHDWHPSEEEDLQVFASHLANGAGIDRERLYLMRIHHKLCFTDLEEREQSIAEAHKKTFKWIFQGDQRPTDPAANDEHTPQWDSFLGWLHSDKNLYWVTGKPGSGKSTLMKYLFQDPRTRTHVGSWQKSHELIMAGFYFWNSGTTMQMSFLGLLQSLLYQALTENIDLIPRLFPNRWQTCLLFGRDVRPWTLSELMKALKTLVSIESLRFLIFVDGLDEFDQDPADLVTFIVKLCDLGSRTSNLKLCVSSRPWLVFEEQFSSCPRLRLEDLTRPDIKAYVEEKLGRNPHWGKLIQFHPPAATRIMTEVVDKSSGVFLWVILVVASLETGLRDGDTVDDLTSRVERLPSSLEDLFRNILEKLEPEYLVQACELFQLATAAVEPLTMLDISFAVEGYDACMNAKVEPLGYSELCFIAENARRRILSRCKGLLETHDFDLKQYDATVQFLHRTVRDFFRSPDVWSYICSRAPEVDPIMNICGACLKRLKMTPQFRDDRFVFTAFWSSFKHCLTYAYAWEKRDEEPPVEYLDELDSVGEVYWNTPLTRNDGASQTLIEELLVANDGSLLPDDFESNHLRRVQRLINIDPGSARLIHWSNTCWLMAGRAAKLIPNKRTTLSCFVDYMSQVNFEAYAKLKREEKSPSLIATEPLPSDGEHTHNSKKDRTPKGLLKSFRSILRMRATKSSDEEMKS